MWPFRQRAAELTPPEWALRARVVTASPQSEAADTVRAALTDLCDHDDTKAGAQGALRAWCTRGRPRGLAAFARVVGTMERWLEELTHDFQGRQPRGCVAGFTHRVKGLKRRGDGSFDRGRRFHRLTLDRHGDQLFGHT